MANETFGGADPEKLAAARRKMLGWGGASALAAVAFIYSFFFGFVPARTEYKQIKEQLCIEQIKQDGTRVDHGCQSRITKNTEVGWLPKLAVADALIVNAGETALRDCFINTSCTPVQNFKYHGLGSGSTAAAETDTTCETEFTTQYNPDSTRATGSQTNNGANIYRTVGTNTVDASATARNFCLMSAASAGTMWTKIVFGGDISLASGDGVQTTYDLTIE